MSKTIMVVDDDPVSKQMTRRNLEQSGYAVLLAADGQEAMNTLQLQRPDIILLDVEMPNVNGYTFLTEMKKNENHASIPVIVLTAHENMEPIFRRHKVKGYLIKPLNTLVMLEKVKSILGE